ncbi:50S ribosomal protein L18 [Candidatus Saccharibacteria bacterium]|nr:MAG: 50S ribosomal protein L18 [Candidatus Saccharibacteria bacterium]
MNKLATKLLNRRLRKNRVRSHIHGTDVRPRLTVFISNMHVSAQIINDDTKQTIASSTTVGAKATGSMKEKAAWVGTEVAKKAKKAKVSAVVFDRNGRQYAGRLQALAEAARKEGLEF